MPLTVDLSPAVLLSRVAKVSRFFAVWGLVVFLGGFVVDPTSRWWLAAIAGAVVVWFINRVPQRIPLLLWTFLLGAAGPFAAAYLIWQVAVILRTAFSLRAVGPVAAVSITAYWVWKTLRRVNSNEQVETSPGMFGVAPGLIERWFSTTWGRVVIGGILIIVSLMVFVPTEDQVVACALLAAGILLVEFTVLVLWPAVRAARQRSAHDLLRVIAKSRRTSVRRSYLWFVLGRMARTPKSLGFLFCGLLVLIGWQLVAAVLPEDTLRSVRPYVGGSMLAALTLCWTRARQYAFKSPNPINPGSEPFTLFLRSFMDEDLTIRRDSLLAQFVMFGDAFFQDSPETNPRSRRFEDLIAETVWPFEKMVAIGRPGEVLPPVGALRIQADPSGERWQEAVQKLIAAAHHVLIAVGISSGLKWEFKQFETGASREKLSLLVVPEQGSVAATWRIFAADYPDLLALSQDIQRGVALRFCSDGAPVLLCARKKSAEAYRIAASACLIPLERFMEVTGRRPAERSATAHAL
jgi:hypothetical protein